MAGHEMAAGKDITGMSSQESLSPVHRPSSQQHEASPCCIPRPFIQTEDLNVYYKKNPALEGVSLTLNAGCLTTLVGPSGCGKTSLLMSLNRLTDLIPFCRVTGKIRLGVLDVLSRQTDVIRLRRRVGMIFQKPNPFPLSIFKNLAFPLREHGIKDRGEVARIIEESLRDVGLWDEVKDRLNEPALGLSGGQQQRLCIARAIALNPEALLMDEPCSALDPLSSGIVEDLILKLRGRYTILIVTHNLAQARRIADYAAFFWMEKGSGRMIEYGPALQIFETPKEALTTAYVNGVRG